MDPQHFDESDKRYYELAEKWLNGSITEEEKKEFSDWYNTNQDHEIEVPEAFAQSEEELENRIRLSILSRRQSVSIDKKNYFILRPFVAAAILLLVAVSVFLLVNSNEQTTTPRITKALLNDRPETKRVVLTLADGSEIVLDDAANGTLADQGATKVIKLNSRQLVYSASDNQKSSSSLLFNTITTPRGGQYQIVLPDDSKVWLNASSSLRFPTSFSGKERKVELVGEAYFEVAKNAHMPFKVSVNDMEIGVLGTHFNVMAYKEEEGVKTTLLEGAVSVSRQQSRILLKPGEQANLQKQDGALTVSKNVDIEEVMAWKNGEFHFKNTDIKSIMRQVTRWYDVSVIYEGDIPRGGLSGIISRKKEVSQLLEILEATRRVRFDLLGDKIIVKPYTEE